MLRKIFMRPIFALWEVPVVWAFWTEEDQLMMAALFGAWLAMQFISEQMGWDR